MATLPIILTQILLNIALKNVKLLAEPIFFNNLRINNPNLPIFSRGSIPNKVPRYPGAPSAAYISHGPIACSTSIFAISSSGKSMTLAILDAVVRESLYKNANSIPVVMNPINANTTAKIIFWFCPPNSKSLSSNAKNITMSPDNNPAIPALIIAILQSKSNLLSASLLFLICISFDEEKFCSKRLTAQFFNNDFFNIKSTFQVI